MKNLFILLLVATLSISAGDLAETEYPRGLTREEFEKELTEVLEEQSDEERQECTAERISDLIEKECDRQEELEAYYTESKKEERKGEQDDKTPSLDPALKSHVPSKRQRNTGK